MKGEFWWAVWCPRNSQPNIHPEDLAFELAPIFWGVNFGQKTIRKHHLQDGPQSPSYKWSYGPLLITGRGPPCTVRERG